ncbi:MAG: Ig-like domain-containing protein [Pseudomonadota bacterium]
MWTKRFRTVTTLAALIVLAAGCSKTNSRALGDFYNTLGGFGVPDSEPRNGDYGVETNTMIRVGFTEPVDPASLANAYKITRIVGGAATDVTTDFDVTMTNANLEVDFIPHNLLSVGASYRLTLGSSVRSVSGKTMVQSFTLLFSTDGVGSRVTPGVAPAVRSVWIDTSDGCLTFVIEYSEDLDEIGGLPKVNVTETTLGIDWLTNGRFFGEPWFFFTTEFDYVGVTIGCDDPDLFDPLARYHVKISGAVDQNGLTQVAPWEGDCGAPGLFSSGDCG